MPSTRRLLAAAAAAIAIACGGITALVARGDGDRTLSFYNIHTKETLTVAYMRGGKRDPEAMKKIDWMFRDWRKNEPTSMDPELIDLVWEVHAELGSKEPIHVISGYRSSGTNEKLRSGGGGQAKNSRHIMGKAADIHFPDVPLKQIRYSGLVRERGGVGYYPTSGVPFVHLDTGNVRHWPRMPRYELALLFPNGGSKHTPSDGRPLTRQDYVVAKSRYQELAQQVAAFFDLRSSPKTTTMVADAGKAAAPAAAWKAETSKPDSAKPAAAVVASAEPAATVAGIGAPRLVAEPKLVARPGGTPPGWSTSPRGTEVALASPKAEPAAKPAAKAAAAAAAVSPTDRSKLTSLFSLASFMPEPKLVKKPEPVSAETRRMALASLTGGSGPAPELPAAEPAEAAEGQRVAAIDPASLEQPGAPQSINDIERAGWSSGWAAAPAFDEEHPDEMSYRPFPVAPLLTDTASADDPTLTRMNHPRVQETLELLGKEDDDMPMKLRPGQQMVALMVAQQFSGKAVDFSSVDDVLHDPIGQLARRSVKTSGR
jgi:uncharacterized protein YcbK (DUF882 family)